MRKIQKIIYQLYDYEVVCRLLAFGGLALILRSQEKVPHQYVMGYIGLGMTGVMGIVSLMHFFKPGWFSNGSKDPEQE